MGLNNIIKSSFLKITGLTLYKKLPFGLNVFEDLKFRFKGYNFQTFLDVGANIGQTAKLMRQSFPKARILSFEPFEETFNVLIKNTTLLNVNCFRIGFGAKKEVLSAFVNIDNKNSDMNSLNIIEQDSESEKIKKVEVSIETLDEFCKINEIKSIDYLKIDTEGFELNVIRGADEYLRNQEISFIECEVSMNKNNTFHNDFCEIKTIMESHNYFIFGIYEQTHEWKTKHQILRRTNVVFISEKIVNKWLSCSFKHC